MRFRGPASEEFDVTVKIHEQFVKQPKGCEECCGSPDRVELRMIQFESTAHTDIFPTLVLSSKPNADHVVIFQPNEAVITDHDYYYEDYSLHLFYDQDQRFRCDLTECLDDPTISNQHFDSIAKLASETRDGQQLIFYITPKLGLLKIERNFFDPADPSSALPTATEEYFLVL